MNKKRIKKYLIMALLVIEVITLSLTYKSYGNRLIDEVKEEHEVEKKSISMYVENGEGNYEEYTESDLFPEGYNLNLEKSSCVDINGNAIDGALKGSGNKVTITSNKTAYCYIYFDKVYTLSELCSNGEELGKCITTNNSEIESLNDNVEGGLYRYQGTQIDVNDNYICFGTTDKNECTSNTDIYMYRIIGVDENNQLKLIKKEALNEAYAWNTDFDYTILWPNSTLYSNVNGSSYLTNSTYMPSGWADKIAETSWKYGNSVYWVNADQTAANLYTYENGLSNITTSKIGLMYLYDYYLAYSNTINCIANSADSQYTKCKDSWVHIRNNDELASGYEFTMTKGPSYSWLIYPNGSVSQISNTSNYSVRPVFYLNSDEIYVNGNGTIDDPIILADKEAPTGNSVVINSNATYTIESGVTLTLASSGATEMCISESESCTNWEAYVSSKTYTLTSTLGTKTIYVTYRDAAGNTTETVSDTISLYSQVSVPSQKGTLTYTGSAQTPSWNNYDSTKLTLRIPTAVAGNYVIGIPSGTNAGSYNATFTPKTNYIWSDGTTGAKIVTWTIGKATISTTPSQSGTLTYTGSAQSPSWSNYDSSKLTLGGTTSGTTARSYNATFTPKTNYMWSDGTTTAKTVSWTIGKAAGSLSVSPTTLSITTGATGTITATRSGNGTVSATSSNTSVATVSVSGTTVTVKGVASGTATITIKVAAGTNHNVPTNKTVRVTVTSPSAGSTILSKKPTGLNTTTAYNGMYRFIGTTANNYVSIGGVLYRIIGITSGENSTLGLEAGQLKVIKAESIGTYNWHTIIKSNATWNTGGTNAAMYTYLQGSSVLGNTSIIPSGWSNRIDSVKWYVGDVNTTTLTNGSTVLGYEDNTVTSGNSKIGLMYLSDYFYAYNAGGTTGCNSTACMSWMTDTSNATWTMTRYGFDSSIGVYYTWNVMSSGQANWSGVLNNAKEVRPVFYLLPAVTVKSGSGTEGDPFILQ